MLCRYCNKQTENIGLHLSQVHKRVSRLSRGSNSLSRPMVFHYVADRAKLETMAAALFDALSRGVLTAEPGKAFPLSEASAAHEELESRRAAGPLLLVP